MAGPYNQLIELGGNKKMVAASEVGRVPSVDLQLAYETDWLYFCSWGDGYINNEEANPRSFLKEVGSPSLFLNYSSVFFYHVVPAGKEQQELTSMVSRSSKTSTF